MNVQAASEPPPNRIHFHPPALKLACREAYVTGAVGSLAELARVKGVPWLTLKSWAHKEHWGQARTRWLERQEQKQEHETKTQPSTSYAQSTANHFDDYTSESLACVREIMREKLAQLRLATDPSEIDRLARAVRSLDEVEQGMSGRPKPGSRRPGKERPAARPEIRPLD